ncbi:MAG: hypothetical protein JWN72_1141, partial [Thermoleophilia bacterium]|nr:hypothetical protein [Thermoleophilia bacterium]
CDTLPGSVMSDCLSGSIMEINFANQSIRNRMKRNDPNLGPTHEVSCSMVAADQKNWCRAFVAKGVLLVTELRTVG